MKNSKRLLTKSFIVTILVVALMLSFSMLASAETVDKLEAGEIAVVNFAPTWGDVEANVDKMLGYINDAYVEGVKILVFPELCVAGYTSSSDPASPIYQMAINTAETADGETATKISHLAQDYDMIIIYGATEVIEGDSEHAYNSAFVCLPNGEVHTYQKIHNVEGAWCTNGTTPLIVDTEYGKMGMSICYDTYATPELSRYYVAAGCKFIINPTATSRGYNRGLNPPAWSWYFNNRIESEAYRDNVIMVNADLAGPDGPNDNYYFPGGSCIVGYDYANNTPVYYGGTSTEYPKMEEPGLIVNTKAIDLTNVPDPTITPEYAALYQELYQELADRKAAGTSLSSRLPANAETGSSFANAPVMAVVQSPKESLTLEEMKTYINEAAAEGAKILVFPETILTGKAYDPATRTQVTEAQTLSGEVATEIAALAQQHGMYIIYGFTEKTDTPMYGLNSQGNNVEKVYNSAAIISPDGKKASYRKIHLEGDEEEWAIAGDTPYIFDTGWTKFMVMLGNEAVNYPELGRYGAAMGAKFIVNPTTTSSTDKWFFEQMYGSYVDRDGTGLIISTVNTEAAPGYSTIMTKRSATTDDTGSTVSYNGTAFEALKVRTATNPNLLVVKPTSTTLSFGITGFNPQVFADAYGRLADNAVADKSALQSLITELNNIVKDLLTADSRAIYDQLLSDAEALLADLTASQSDYDDFVAQARTIIDGFEYIPVDKTELELLVELLEYVNPAWFTDASQDILVQLVADAKDLLADKNATQEEVDAFVANADKVIAGLELKFNFEGLKGLFQKLVDVDFDKLTDESQKAYDKLWNDMTELLMQEVLTQKDIDDFITYANGVIDGFKYVGEVPTDPKPTPKPSDDPKTGDNTTIVLFAVLLIVSLCGVVFIIKKRATIKS